MSFTTVIVFTLLFVLILNFILSVLEMKLPTATIGVIMVCILTAAAYFLSVYIPHGNIVFIILSLSFAYKKYGNLNWKIDNAVAEELNPTYGPDYDYENSSENFLKRVKALRRETKQQWIFISLILVTSAILYILFFSKLL